MKINEKIEKFTDRFFRYCGVRHLGIPKGVKALNFQFCPCFADHCDPIFHLGKIFIYYHFPQISGYTLQIFSDFFKQYQRFLKICHKGNQLYKF
jgi:hypothetical protein